MTEKAMSVFILTRHACLQAVEEAKALLAQSSLARDHPDYAQELSNLIDGISMKVAEVRFDPEWENG